MQMAGGIYAISRKGCAKNFYIGSAVSLAKRWSQHRRLLRACKHHSPHLQSAWSKYGEDAFEFTILEPVDDRKHLIGREQTWIDRYAPTYNVCKIAGSKLGVKHSEVTRAKMSASHVGAKRSAETCANISLALKGRVISEEARVRMAASMREKAANDPAFRAALAQRAEVGRAVAAERRAQGFVPRKPPKGLKRRPMSEAARAKISAALVGKNTWSKGRSLSSEHRAKLSAANTGNAKLSAATRATWAARRSEQ
jgi:group I intron endonuclease